jgi:hypothetical protein
MWLAALIWWLLASAAPAETFTRTMDIARAGEVIATVFASCAGCAWGEAGREAVTLRLSIDGRYSQHIVLTRGGSGADYPVTLGALPAGPHQITIEPDPALSAPGAGPASVGGVGITVVAQDLMDDWTAQSMAPILHARPNTVGRFTDVPILMWYEIVPTGRGRQFRYSVVFTNEDGGTATDRLMATWGRTTDIEFVYGVELDSKGVVIAEEFQGPGHDVPPFAGRHEGRHPLLWVSTDNNMVSESGSTTVRYAPAPERLNLRDVSREVVMDRHAWSYAVAAQELRREAKIVNGAAAGSGAIPDPRRFAFIEACAELENAAVAFAVRVVEGGAARWYESDRGLREFRVARTGCFRGAVPLPASAGAPDALRFRAYSLPPKAGEAPRLASVRVTRVNRIFMLGDDYVPRPSQYSWRGSLTLPIDGAWQEVK